MNLNPELKIFVHINEKDLFLNGFLQQKAKVEHTMGTKIDTRLSSLINHTESCSVLSSIKISCCFTHPIPTGEKIKRMV